MKIQNLLFAIAIICSSIVNVCAQSNKKRPNEIGFFVEMNNNYTSNYSSSRGLNYRREVKENKFRRFQLINTSTSAYGYNYNKPFSVVQKNDTIITKNLINNMNGYGIGYGIEKQRNFYKKVFLYAALDVRLIYNKHDFFQNIDTSILSNEIYTSMKNLNNSTIRVPNFNANGYYLSVMPTIGAKIDIRNRIVVGTETMITSSFGFYSQKATTNYTIFDFDIDLFTQKFYINYKF